MIARLVTTVSLLLACIGCAGEPPRDASLFDVSFPDVSRVDPGVQEQLRERQSILQSVLARDDASSVERGEAYGLLAMLLHAAEYYDAAEPAYRNAEILIPADRRWPYYLAHLYKSRGERPQSMIAFARVLELQPDYVPALVWLGRMHLDDGDVERAQLLFDRAYRLAPRQVAVLAGLGQAALARRDFVRAASVLQTALAIDPSASSIHAPLAVAYRALGDGERAARHSAEWRNTEILLADPLRQELDLVLNSGLSFELRGIRALEAKRFDFAAEFFRQGAALTPSTTALGRSLRHKLGTALFLAGDAAAAIVQFNEVVASSPSQGLDETAAKAHYSLGVISATQLRDEEAIAHLSAALRYSPNYVEARQALGDALRRSGRDADSLTHYEAAVRIAPQSADARFGYAMALVRLRRYREAYDWLAAAREMHPERDEFTHAMARLLAAAADNGVRDGARALALVDTLLRGEKTVALGETTAMALAESGRYDEAAAVQRQIIKAAHEAGLTVDVDRLRAELQRYVDGEPWRTPWSADDPVHRPPPPATAGWGDVARQSRSTNITSSATHSSERSSRRRPS
jgi:tetratricopeptide (TPR) repeat protein